MVICGLVAVQVANEANAKCDIIKIIARNVTSVDLLSPAITDFDLSVARGLSVSNHKVVGEAVLHFSNAAVVVVKDPGIALACAAVVNNDVFPSPAFDFRIIDCLANGGGKITPAFEGADAKTLLRWLVAFFILEP